MDKALKRAIFFMCAMIVISVICGGMRSIKAYQRAVTDEYRSGGAAESSESITACAHNLLTVAERYIAEDDAVTSLKTVIKSAADLKSANSWIPEVVNGSYELYKKLGECLMTEQDAAYRVELFAQIKSDYSVLCGAEYNSDAAEYNKTLKVFPASIFARMTNIDELPVFSKDDVKTEG